MLFTRNGLYPIARSPTVSLPVILLTMTLPDLKNVYSVIESEFKSFCDHADVDSAPFLSEMATRFRKSLSGTSSVTDPAMYCIDRFVSAEMDFVTPGQRGMGRVSEVVPRFAAKHRSTFSQMPFKGKQDITEAIHNHLACGYLYIDMCYPHLPHAREKFDNATLFDAWISLIYSPPKAIEPNSDDDWEEWGMWCAATGKLVQQAAIEMGLAWDNEDKPSSDRNIVTKYFDAGTTLRYAEAILSSPQTRPSSPPSSPQSTSTRATISTRASTPTPTSTTGINGWMIAGVIGFVVLLFICCGGLGGDPTYDPYRDNPLSDPDLYGDPWPR